MSVGPPRLPDATLRHPGDILQQPPRRQRRHRLPRLPRTVLVKKEKMKIVRLTCLPDGEGGKCLLDLRLPDGGADNVCWTPAYLM